MYQQELKQVNALPIHNKFLELKDIFVPPRIHKNSTVESQNGRQSEEENTFSTLNDIFYCNNTFADRIFIKGESGTGKTTLCLKLLESWMKAKQSNNISIDSLEECLAVFDLVFYIPLGDCRHTNMYLVDMICEHISKGDPRMRNEIKQVLCCPEIRCLVIADGIDELITSQRELEFPDTYGLVNSILLSTMRPWVLSYMPIKMKELDTAYEVLGLHPDHIDDMISKILIHFCGLQTNSVEYQTKHANFCNNIKQSALNVIYNPMMLLPLILLWNEKYCIDYNHKNISMAQLYLSMVDVMIQRAETKDHDVKSYIQKFIECGQNSTIHVLDEMSGFRYISYLGEVFLPFCKLAFESFVGDHCLLFEKHQLQREIGSETVKLALKIGVISERMTNNTACKQQITVHFLHKSIQEFLAAIYIVEKGKKVLKSFLGKCSSVIYVMKMNILIAFICGLNVNIADHILRHVLKVAESDVQISWYRRLYNMELAYEVHEPDVNIHNGEDKVKYLYSFQCLWYKELTMDTLHKRNLENVDYHISEIFLDKSNDKETIDITVDIMHKRCNKLKSVSLRDQDIVRENILRVLSDCKYITSLHVCHMLDTTARSLLYSALQRLSRLQYVEYSCSKRNQLRTDDHTAFLGSLVCKPKRIKLSDIAIAENSFSHIFCAKCLETLEFHGVFMTYQGWNTLIDSLGRMQQKSTVLLIKTNIDDLSVSSITSNPNFTVVCNDSTLDDNNRRFILFYTYPPHELTFIRLANTTIHVGSLLITSAMTSLNEIRLAINMTETSWKALIVALFSMRNKILVTLEDTNIDADSVSHIVESSVLTVISNSQRSEDGRYKCLCFYTIPPYKIKKISLQNCTFSDNGITISDDMVRLEEINLTSVLMSSEGWRKFTDCICNVQNNWLRVILNRTNIDYQSVSLISSCPNNAISRRGRGKNNKLVVIGLKRDRWVSIGFFVAFLVGLLVGSVVVVICAINHLVDDMYIGLFVYALIFIIEAFIVGVMFNVAWSFLINCLCK